MSLERLISFAIGCVVLAILVVLLLWMLGKVSIANGASSVPPKAAILTTKRADVCTPGWAAAHRHVTAAQRSDLFAAAGITNRTGWIVDHRVSLEVGGSNASVNLQLQTTADSRAKDRVEDATHDAICAKTLSVRAGQLRLWRWKPSSVQVAGSIESRLRRQLLIERIRHRRALARLRLVMLHSTSVSEAIALAARVYGVSEAAMRRVAFCESRFDPNAHNASSASGLFQFLTSTWAHTPFADFSVWSPYANALAAAFTVRGDGGWRQWVCRP